MSDFHTLEKPVLNYRNHDKTLALEIGSRDGFVFIGLRDDEKQIDLKGIAEPAAAQDILKALTKAIQEAQS